MMLSMKSKTVMRYKMSEHNLSTSDIAEMYECQKRNLMPDGAYTASIIEAVMVPYKSLSGEYVRVTFEGYSGW